MDNADERWLSRRELAERYGLPVKTLAQWASKGTGPRYARMGRHVRYRLSDVIDWETQRFDEIPYDHADAGILTNPPTNRWRTRRPRKHVLAERRTCHDPHHL
ncbi:MAG: hypothetical protein QOC63_5833 [Mycobacterium sp.]|jgi:predicted DNA-binding transcriptional regulator AlpA|nr:hypothetical protein [Mycobacterium sp.]